MTVDPSGLDYNFCTLFDRNYASRGLALYWSLMRVCRKPFKLTILCMDEETHDAFESLALPGVRLWKVEDLADSEVLELRKTRPKREFCWTCAGPLLLAMLREREPGGLATYLDADLAFFSDPGPIYRELGNSNILIHAHRFAPQYEHFAAFSGVFNVGLIAVRNGPEAIQCLQRWRAQNIEMCVLDPEQGHCGDQKYLDEWPSLYPNLVILQHPGGGVAPWNVEAHAVTQRNGQVLIDGAPLIFYHYHALRVVLGRPWSRWAAIPSMGYKLDVAVRRYIYRPYVQALREGQKKLTAIGLKSSSLSIPPRQFISLIRHGQLVIG